MILSSRVLFSSIVRDELPWHQMNEKIAVQKVRFHRGSIEKLSGCSFQDEVLAHQVSAQKTAFSNLKTR